MFKVTILGCGASSGVPAIGNKWGECDPSNSKNRRSRASIFIESPQTKLLVDTSPDLREQFLRENIGDIDAVFFTHEHSDHTHGIDDLRTISFLNDKTINAYSDERCMNDLKQRFSYLFGEGYNPATPKDFRLILNSSTINIEPFKIGDIPIRPFLQDHGSITSLGLRINDFAYSTDVVNLDEKAFEILFGVKIWVVDCLRRTESKVHVHLDKVLKWIDILKPEQVYLTHLSLEMDYETLCNELPDFIRPAYDGLSFYF